jgi:hypothetical protein
MFLLYYLVNLFNFLFYTNLNHFNKIYLIFNKFNLIFKKSFKKITFFEKFILVLLYKNNWFFKSIKNFSNYNNIVNDFRKKNFPLLNFFYFYNFIFNNKFINLYFLKKIFIFFKKYKFIKNISFLNFIILQKFFFIKYYNLLNKNFFKSIDYKNLIKLNFLFYYFNKNTLNNKNYKFNLNYYNDWYVYLFNTFNKFSVVDFDKTDLINLKTKKINYIDNIIKIYNKSYKFNNVELYKKNYFINNLNNYINFYFNNLNLSFFKKINFSRIFFKKSFDNTPIRFSSSSMNKYINFYNLTNYNFFYLRKNKIFNKGRYSRNRQLYRTGVYWCLWLNIIIVYGLYFFFYRFTFNFGYLWFGLIILIFSTIFSRVLKYKFYNIFVLFSEFFSLVIWFNLIFKNFFINIKLFLIRLAVKINLNLTLFNTSNLIIFNFFKLLVLAIAKLNKKKDYGYVFIWKNYSSDDKSLFKFKSILNWFIQLYKVLVY